MKKGIIFIAIFTLFLIYRFISDKSYDSVDITPILDEIRSSLSDNQELVILNSKNPFNLYDILNNEDFISSQQVYGILSFPSNPQNTSIPLVMGVAGSYGWKEHHIGYMKRYLDDGFATFTLHSFESRNVKSTVGEQVSTTVAMIIYDAYMALHELSERSNIDSNNIGITGWSLGGGVSLFSAWKPIVDAISPNNKFAAHLPIYPPCMAKPSNMSFTDSPVHILIGELDDWVPAEPCEEIIREMRKTGHNASITVYPNSHHAFDREQDLEVIDHAYSFKDCRLTLKDNGEVATNNIHFPLFSPIMQKIGLLFCAERGSTIGGNDSAREASKNFALEFMNKYLKD